MLHRPHRRSYPVVDGGPRRRHLDPALAREINAARRGQEYTIRQLADLTGISKTMIGYLCRGERLPSKGFAHRIAVALALDEATADRLWEAAVTRGWPTP